MPNLLMVSSFVGYCKSRKTRDHHPTPNSVLIHLQMIAIGRCKVLNHSWLSYWWRNFTAC